MNISPLSTTANQSATVTQTQSRTALTQEDFLKLFTTQLQYQDPTQPLDNFQMASQLAQFGSLEALNNMSQAMTNLGAYQASMNNLQAAGLLGKKVEATGNGLSVTQGTVSDGYYQLSTAGKVTVKIYDSNHNLIRTIDKGSRDTSKQSIAWDGKNDQGQTVSDGKYTFEVSAVDGQNGSISVSSSMAGVVTEMSFENGVTCLKIGGETVTISDIIRIMI